MVFEVVENLDIQYIACHAVLLTFELAELENIAC